MSELPTGWLGVRIGELCELVNGRAFKPQEWSKDGLPIIRIQNLNKPSAEFNRFSGELDRRHLVTPGQLLFAWSGTPGTSFGAHVWNGPKAALNQHIFKIDFDVEHVDKIFFRHAINQKLDELIGSAQGGVGLRHVTKGTFERTQISLPPLAEQKRIAQKLDTLLAQVDTLKARIDAIPALLKRFRQSVIGAAVEGRLARGGTMSIETEIWPTIRAEDVCTKVQSGGTPKEGFTASGIPFLKVYNLVNGAVDLDHKPQYIAREVHNGTSRKSITRPGDVLMNIVGPPLGKIAVVPADHPEWNINQAITLFRPSELATSGWIHLVLLEGSSIRSVSQETKGSAGQVNISLSQCRNFLFPVPPLSRQREITSRVEQLFAFVDQLEAKVATAKQRIDTLTQSLLAKAFRGELVPQDPNDEPASVLLERIRAQRAAAPKPRRGRKAAVAN